MKNEKKSLEELQKTDPEAYMEKINTVDKQRVEVKYTVLILLSIRFDCFFIPYISMCSYVLHVEQCKIYCLE